jgi:hypothetical protein
MMKPVCKYRCWHLPTKKMYSVYGLDFLSGGVVQSGPVQIQIGEKKWVSSETCYLMQSTGKTSRSGLEIFENDLVTRPCQDETCSGPHTGEVVWDNMFLEWVINDSVEERIWPLNGYDPETGEPMPIELLGNAFQEPPST